MKKHKPPIPLQQRKQQVSEILDRDYPDMNPLARDLLLKYPEVVHLDNVPFVGTSTVSHKIIYTGPVYWNRQYRTPHVLAEDIKREISRLIQEGIIEPSESEFNNAILPVAKTDPVTGKLKLRIVADFRSLNKSILVDRLPISDIQDLLNKLDGVQYVSVLDAASGYLQINLEPESQKYTAFRYDNKAYTYKKLAFGLGSAPSTYIRLMNVVLSGLSSCFCYMDDIIIFSKTKEEHLQTLDLVLKRFSFHGLELSLKKSNFIKKEVEYLGFTVSRDGLKTAPKTLKPMLNIELPTNLTEARRLCSLFSFYRRFIKNYASIAEPLVNLTRGHGTAKGTSTKVTPTRECAEALEKLKESLRKDVCLKYPNFSKPFIVTSDGSLSGLGAHLAQLDDKGHQRPLAFASRALHGSERNYPPVELECLAIVYALKQFRHVILGYAIDVFTDHKPLIYLMKHVDPTSRLYRYQLSLLEYNIRNIDYIQGTDNSVADYLSRFSLGADEDLNPTVVCHSDSAMAGATPPSYQYDQAETLKPRDDTLVVICGNARNLTEPEIGPELSPVKQIFSQLYETRQAIEPDLDVATRNSCPDVGEVTYIQDNGNKYAIIFTNLLDKPVKHSKKINLAKQMAAHPVLIAEGFKFKLKADNTHVRDYYFMAGLEEIIKYCSEFPSIKRVMLLWPHSVGTFEYEGKRMKNTISHLNHFGYALWQQNKKLTVVGQPDVNLEDIDMFCNAASLEATSKVTKEKLNLDLIIKEQATDKGVQEILSKMLNSQDVKEEYWQNDGILFKIDTNASRDDTARVYIPTSLTELVLNMYHDQSAHQGMAKTHMQCSSQVYWPNMQKDIKQYIAKCLLCVQAKCSVNRRVMSGHLLLPPHANHTLAIDLLGSLPRTGKHDQCIIAVCAYSRYVRVLPLQNGTAARVIDALNLIFSWQSKCQVIISDNAGCFKSNKFKEYLDELEIEHHFITPYNPQSNLAERSIRNVLSVLRVLSQNRPRNWDEHLPTVCDAINVGFNLSLQERPFYFFYGRDPTPNENFLNRTMTEITPSELFSRTKYSFETVEKILTEEHSKEDKKLMSSGRLTSYEIGDIVFVQRNFVNEPAYKILYPYTGPYRVVKIIGNTVDLVNLSNGQPRRCAMRNIKIYKIDDLTKTNHPNVNKKISLQSNNPDELAILENAPAEYPKQKIKNKNPVNPRPYNLRSKREVNVIYKIPNI